jgi:thioredoxin-related protein
MPIQSSRWWATARYRLALVGLAIASAGSPAPAQTVQVAKTKATPANASVAHDKHAPSHEKRAIAEKITWFTEVEPAWQAAQREGRPLLVYVTHDECVYCRKMEKQTYVDRAVTTAIQSDFVPLSLNGAKSSPLIKDLAVKSYPATFVISPQAVVLDRIDGYVPPEQLARRLASVTPRKSGRAPAQPVAERKPSGTARAW